jgi:hypothetical protein
MVEPDAQVYSSSIALLMSRLCSGKGKVASILKQNTADTQLSAAAATAKLKEEVNNIIMECWKQTGVSKIPVVVSALKAWLAKNKDGKI